MTSNKGKRPLRHLTAGDKIDAIQRIHDGESKASVARDIGVPESTLRGWCKNEEKLRYMSRQSGVDNKMSVEKLTEKMADDAAMAAAAVSMFGPPEKRQKLDTSLPLGYGSNGGKMKYDDMGYKSRNSMTALDFSTTDKGLSQLNFNGLGQPDYSAAYKSASDLSALNGHGKHKDNALLKGYGADMSKPNDPTKSDMSMAAISPLTSLSHLSGMSGIAQGLSFNEIASNLSLLYNNQSALGSMAGLGNLNNSPQNSSNLRTVRQKQSLSSPRSELEKSQSLTVKNLAKLQQKGSNNDLIGMGMSDMNEKLKKPMAAALSRDAPVDDAVMYWLRSQQAMLGLNNLYSSMPSAASPSRSSPLQQHQQHLQQQLAQQLQHSQQSMLPSSTSTPPPISTTPQTPSTTPSGTSEDTKNSSWFWQWYKTFGSQLITDKQNAMNNNNTAATKPMYENILYSQLTKESLTRNTPSPRNDAINNNVHADNKPEDLSSQANIGHRSSPEMSPPPAPRPASSSQALHEMDHAQLSPQNEPMRMHVDHATTPSPAASPLAATTTDNLTASIAATAAGGAAEPTEKTQTSVRSVLDNLLYNNNNITNNNNINNNNHHNSNHSVGSPNSCSGESDASGPNEAVEHGEKFLKWLESCSDPSITAMQVMQFRTLLNTIKTSADRANNPIVATEERSRNRRRK